MDKIINLNGNAVELSKIKAISVNEFHKVKQSTREIKIELASRKEYILNPENEKHELHTINEVVMIEYPDNDTAIKIYFEMMQIWEDSLEEFD